MMRLPKIKWNTKIHFVQMVLITIGLLQLLQNAIFMGLVSILLVYPIGALENGER